MLDAIFVHREEPKNLADAFDLRSPYAAGVLLHGFGASGEDLASLAPLFPVRDRWLFPHAPEALSFGGAVYGRGWFPRDPRAMEAALTGAYFSGLGEQDPPGLSQAASEVLEVADYHALNWGEAILGGFSQGAMVAVEVALRAPEPPKALLLFSGSIIAAERWKGAAAEAAEAGALPSTFVQSHGTEDAVLPYQQGRALFDLLRGAGWNGGFLSFSGGHEIPPDVVREAHRVLYS
mgnify:CR=1 FL=1